MKRQLYRGRIFQMAVMPTLGLRVAALSHLQRKQRQSLHQNPWSRQTTTAPSWTAGTSECWGWTQQPLGHWPTVQVRVLFKKKKKNKRKINTKIQTYTLNAKDKYNNPLNWKYNILFLLFDQQGTLKIDDKDTLCILTNIWRLKETH